MKYFFMIGILAFAGISTNIASTQPDFTSVSMTTHGAGTFYVRNQIPGLGELDMMVDTGSGYSTINEHSLAILKQKGQAHYKKDLIGILANGQRMKVEVYTIKAMNIGGSCWLRNVDAAVFPGKTRQILGLSALSKTAPFTFSMQPAELKLSNCKAQLSS